MADQLNLFTTAAAQSAAETGMARAAAATEQLTPGFSDEAAAFILRYLRRHGGMPGERIVLACRESGIVPHDDRAFGPVFRRLSQQGQIQKLGTCKRLRGHHAPGGTVWGLADDWLRTSVQSATRSKP